MEDVPLPTDAADSSSATLESLELRRAALQRLLQITRSAEIIKLSLEGVNELGADFQQFPEETMRFYQEISHQLSHLSNAELNTKFLVLQSEVTEQLANLIDELDNKDLNAQNDNELALLDKRFKVFQRLTQTATAMRVLLNKRGRPDQACHLGIDPIRLQSKIEQAKSDEHKYRHQVIEEMEEFKLELEQLLELPYPKHLSQAFADTLNDLHLNKQHLLSGKSINELPVSMETLEFSEQEETMETTEASVEKEDQHRVPAPTTTNNEPINEAKTAANQVPAKPPALSLWKAIILWLNTPWGVDFKEIFKNRR